MERSRPIAGVVLETEFWKRLEHRVSRELSGLSDKRLSAFWCDGFIPETFDSYRHYFVGDVWIANGSVDQQKWRFELIADVTLESEAARRWQNLLPDDEMTGWLSLDFDKRLLRIDLQKGYPDVSCGD